MIAFWHVVQLYAEYNIRNKRNISGANSAVWSKGTGVLVNKQ